MENIISICAGLESSTSSDECPSQLRSSLSRFHFRFHISMSLANEYVVHYYPLIYNIQCNVDNHQARISLTHRALTCSCEPIALEHACILYHNNVWCFLSVYVCLVQVSFSQLLVTRGEPDTLHMKNFISIVRLKAIFLFLFFLFVAWPVLARRRHSYNTRICNTIRRQPQ